MDFVVERGSDLLGIEIKATSRPTGAALAATFVPVRRAARGSAVESLRSE